MSEQRRMSRDELLSRRQTAEQREDDANQAHEERRVKFLLSRLMMPERKWTLLKLCEERTGIKRLTLDLFAEMVPNFPILLSHSKKAGGKEGVVPLPQLFKNFAKAPFVKAYEEFYEEAEPRANNRALGLLFPRRGIIQGLIIHDGKGLDAYWNHGMMLVYTGGTRDCPIRLYVEPFASLVEAIHHKGHGWKPEFAF